MSNFEEKTQELIKVVKKQIEDKQKTYIDCPNDEVLRMLIEKYKELLEKLKTMDKNQIIEFLSNLIDILKKLILNNAESYETNEHFRMVFIVYYLFSNRKLDIDAYLSYELTNHNLDTILKNAKNRVDSDK